MKHWKFLILFLCLFLACNKPEVPVQTSYQESEINIRLLILKHAWEPMADDDANLAIRAINAASAKGLHIKTIGNYRIDKEGKRVKIAQYEDLSHLQEFISEQMKTDATPGDTVIVFTIGHGFGSGDLQRLGQRTDVAKAIAGAAAENQQETLWWQLSCHAQARLPNIENLPANQQEYISILSSSDANTPSASGVQGHIMEKLFVDIADRSKSIDPNGDDKISAEEFKNWLNSGRQQRGNLLSVISSNKIIFGGSFRVRQIPIVDMIDPNRKYPQDYIPIPNRSKAIPLD